jgi:phage-related protein
MSTTDIPLEFVGTARDDLSEFPLECKREIGLALRTAQKGEKAGNAKPMKGFGGAGVLEISSTIYVLHAFQKKSKRGIKTSLNDINKIKARLKQATELHEEKEDEQSKKHKKQR